jgi:hypothetical protein
VDVGVGGIILGIMTKLAASAQCTIGHFFNEIKLQLQTK